MGLLDHMVQISFIKNSQGSKAVTINLANISGKVSAAEKWSLVSVVLAVSKKNKIK